MDFDSSYLSDVRIRCSILLVCCFVGLYIVWFFFNGGYATDFRNIYYDGYFRFPLRLDGKHIRFEIVGYVGSSLVDWIRQLVFHKNYLKVSFSLIILVYF